VSFAEPGAPRNLSASLNVSPELIATIVRPQGAAEAFATRNIEIVPRSYRAAILAGFVVAILNAAANVTFTLKTSETLSHFSLGEAKVPVLAALLLAALWSAAQSSTLCLLVAHRLLVAMKQTSYVAYVGAAGAAALFLAIATEFLLGSPPGPGGFGMALVSGMVTGLFYRLFAGTQRQDS
jgi:hypothetical protein